jgi:hypothetical protein
MDALRHQVHTAYKTAVESVTPARSMPGVASGKLNVAEFVAAGDFLVQACPTWQWEARSWPLLAPKPAVQEASPPTHDPHAARSGGHRTQRQVLPAAGQAVPVHAQRAVRGASQRDGAGDT